MNKGLAVWLLEYVRDHKGLEEATLRQLFDAQGEMMDYYQPKVAPLVDQVLKKHGYTRQQWNDVLLRASHWAQIGVTEKDGEVNRDIIKALKDKGLKISIPAQDIRYLAAVLNASIRRVKRPKIKRYMGPQGVWVYSLKKQ